MKTRILAAIALVVALPAAAQANSVMEQRAFAQQHEALNTQATSSYHVLPTEYRVDTVSGGHSVAADRALASVEDSTGTGRISLAAMANWSARVRALPRPRRCRT